MKTTLKRSHLVALLCLFFSLASCTNDDGPDYDFIPLFPESDMAMIHGGSERAWQITELVNKYYDPNYHLEIELECVADDVYTFNSTGEVNIDLGEDKCFQQNDDGIFTADVEIFESELMYLGEEGVDGTIALRVSRGYVNNDNTATGITIRIYKLAELSEERMVFHREGGKIVGQYKEALVFERL